jgi:hypothetical protein
MHTKNLFVADDGSTLCVVDPKYRCIGSAYGFNEEPQYDEKGELLNRLTSNDEARANAKLWAAAADLAAALAAILPNIRHEIPNICARFQCEENAIQAHDDLNQMVRDAEDALEKAGIA